MVEEQEIYTTRSERQEARNKELAELKLTIQTAEHRFDNGYNEACQVYTQIVIAKALVGILERLNEMESLRS